MTITDFTFNMQSKTYKDQLFERCKRTKRPPDVCPCETDEYDDSEELSEEEPKSILYSFKSLFDIPIKFDGDDVSYFSQPSDPYEVAGAQYYLKMTFCYSQPGLTIRVKLGPNAKIREIRTGRSNGDGYFAEKMEKEYTYKPDMLWFGERSMRSLKIAFLKNQSDFLGFGSNIWSHGGRTYEIVDKKFCKSNRLDRCCGCCNTWCEPMSDTTGIRMIPIRTSYRRRISVSCTPEWYIQYQISSCFDYSYCARIILKLIGEDVDEIRKSYDAQKTIE
jgi:hypothetical protein